MKNLLQDLCTLTTLSDSKLQKILDKCIIIIASYVHEAIVNNEDFVDIDIYIGILSIRLSNEEFSFKFIPKQTLTKKIAKIKRTDNDPIVAELEKSITNKFLETFKDLF